MTSSRLVAAATLSTMLVLAACSDSDDPAEIASTDLPSTTGDSSRATTQAPADDVAQTFDRGDAAETTDDAATATAEPESRIGIGIDEAQAYAGPAGPGLGERLRRPRGYGAPRAGGPHGLRRRGVAHRERHARHDGVCRRATARGHRVASELVTVREQLVGARGS